MHDVLHDVDTRTCHGQIYTAVMDFVQALAQLQSRAAARCGDALRPRGIWVGSRAV